MEVQRIVSEMDERYLGLLRANVSTFIQAAAQVSDEAGARVLDVAPQDHAGARAHFRFAQVETLDIDPSSGADFIADLCETNDTLIPDGSFDVVVCTEVLEHTMNPFDAVAEIARILRPGGRVYASTPFNFRIHGPLPDCWRFTEHGLRALFAGYDEVVIEALEEPERFLMPIHYTLTATMR